jgi:hypothetical protein
VPVKVGRNWSIGSIGTKGALPASGRSSYVDFKIPMRDIYGRVGFEEWVIKQSQSKKGAWAYVVDAEMNGMVEDMAFRRNVIGWLAGFGILALVNGAHAATTTLTVKAPGNVTGTTMPNRYLQGDATSGMYLAILDSATQAVKWTGRITACNATGADVTVDSAITAADGDYVVSAQTPTGNSYNKEPEGILAGHRRRHLRGDVSQRQPDRLPDHEVLRRDRRRPALARRDAAADRRDEHPRRQGRRPARHGARRAARLPRRCSSPTAATPAPTSRARTAAPSRGEEADRPHDHVRRHSVPRRPRRALRDDLRHQQGVVGPLRRDRRRVGAKRRARPEVGERVRRIHRVLPHLRELPLPHARAEFPDGRHHRQPDRGAQLLSRHYTIQPGFFTTDYGAALHFKARAVVPGSRNPETNFQASFIAIIGVAAPTKDGLKVLKPVDDPLQWEPFTDEECRNTGTRSKRSTARG